ncbi:MAG TPA: hypothetical protein VF306_20740 [Pirellulales bacterium]
MGAPETAVLSSFIYRGRRAEPHRRAVFEATVRPVELEYGPGKARARGFWGKFAPKVSA